MTVAELVQKLADLPQDTNLTFMVMEKDEDGFLYNNGSFREIMFAPDETVPIATIFVNLEDEVYPNVR